MVSDLNVLRSSPSDRVQGQIYGTLVITMDGNGVVDIIAEFRKEAPIPCGLVGRVGHSHVFGFSGVLGHSPLLSRRPAYSTTS